MAMNCEISRGQGCKYRVLFPCNVGEGGIHGNVEKRGEIVRVRCIVEPIFGGDSGGNN